MSTDAQISANRANSQHSTGPRTEEGKAASARNGLTLGLFTKGDYVRDEEREEYLLMRTAFSADFNPQTALEHTYVAAILSAAWRLRRCSDVEFRMAGFFGLDPMEDQVALPIQTSVDRARAQSFNILRRSTTELRRLQTDRALRTSDTNDLVSQVQIVSTLAHAKRAKILPFPPPTEEPHKD
jgi:hypothetical protein